MKNIGPVGQNTESDVIFRMALEIIIINIRAAWRPPQVSSSNGLTVVIMDGNSIR
jgi:hypothetical protein